MKDPHTASSQAYIIEGGLEGKKRLNILSGVLKESTQELIERDGSIAGKRFLDIGCGGGHVALMVAEKVGADGFVSAIDFDEEIIKLARQDAAAKNLKNISFSVQSTDALSDHNSYDIVYARFLLSHLKNPVAVLGKMVRALVPGGRLIVEDIDFSGHYCYPSCRSFNAYVSLFQAAARNNGHDADIGLSLFEKLQSCGLQEVRYDVKQPVFNTGDGKWMAYVTMDKIKNTLLTQQLVSSAEVNAILRELEVFTRNEHTIISLPRIFSVWGYNH